MTFDEFQQLQQCPSQLSPVLQALWYDKNGHWDTAHEIVQDAGDQDSAWVHAYLHRKEGDLSNARYWYRRSGRSESHGALSQEWELLAKNLLLN
jgi:hypothetical protein